MTDYNQNWWQKQKCGFWSQVYHQKSEYKERDFEVTDNSLIAVQADTMVPRFKDEEVKAPKNRVTFPIC